MSEEEIKEETNEEFDLDKELEGDLGLGDPLPPEESDPEPPPDPESKSEDDHPVGDPKPDDPTPEPEPDLEPGTIEYVNKENERLKSLLNETYGNVPVQPVVEKPTEDPKPEVAQPAQPAPGVEPVKNEPIDFVGDETLDKFLDTREGLNDLLNKVVTETRKSTEAQIYEKVVQSVPDLVVKYVANMRTVEGLRNQFYETNQDLKPYPRIVAAVANKLSAEHSDWDMDKIFEEAASETRKTLGLIKGAKPEETLDPAFAGKQTPARTQTGNDLGGLAKEIDELM